jgi:hypothetical protein
VRCAFNEAPRGAGRSPTSRTWRISRACRR